MQPGIESQYANSSTPQWKGMQRIAGGIFGGVSGKSNLYVSSTVYNYCYPFAIHSSNVIRQWPRIDSHLSIAFCMCVFVKNMLKIILSELKYNYLLWLQSKIVFSLKLLIQKKKTRIKLINFLFRSGTCCTNLCGWKWNNCVVFYNNYCCEYKKDRVKMNIYQFIMRILEKFRTSDYQSDVSGASHSDPSQEVILQSILLIITVKELLTT